MRAGFHFHSKRIDVGHAHLWSQMAETAKREKVVYALIMNFPKREIFGSNVIDVGGGADILKKIVRRHHIHCVDMFRVPFVDRLRPCPATGTNFENHSIRIDERLYAAEINYMQA